MSDLVATQPIEAPQATTAEPTRFSPVRLDKFIVLYLTTAGLYQLVWFYRNWQYVKRAENSRLWVWARALFAPIVYYALLTRLPVRGRAGLAIAFWIIAGGSRLPDPYWLLFLLSFLPLLPAVQAINGLNDLSARRPKSYGWRGRSIVAAILGGCVMLPLGMMMIIGPPSAVVRGAELRAGYLDYLREARLLHPDEEVLYFYSTGLLSMKRDGVFASDLGITSYWVDPVTEELQIAYLAYERIEALEVNYSTSPLEDTVVRVTGQGNAWFLFYLSPEGGGDRAFLEEVERQRQRSRATNSAAA